MSKGRTIKIGRTAGVIISGAATARNLLVGPGGDPIQKLMTGNPTAALDAIVQNGQANFTPAAIIATITPAVTMGITGWALDKVGANPTASVGKWKVKAI